MMEVYMLMVSTSGNKVVNIEMKEVNEAAQRMSVPTVGPILSKHYVIHIVGTIAKRQDNCKIN